jgi:hypothetical protein
MEDPGKLPVCIMTKRKKSPKTKWVVAVALVVFASVLAASLLTYRGQPSPPKKTPDQYFSFTSLAAEATNVSSTIVKISTLYFNITAIGGDAHHLNIQPPGMVDPQDYPQYDEAPNGTALPVQLTFPNPVLSAEKAQGFPINIKLYSDEAEGMITLYIPASDVFT